MTDANLVGTRPWHTDDVDLDELARLAEAYRRAQGEADELRPKLFAAIREASGDDETKQVDIVNATGFTREHIRRIVKAQAKTSK
ncbi:hypothetical protein [Glycomyces rutgersensis]